MVAALIETDLFVQRTKRSVDARANETLARELLHFLFEFTLAAAHDGRHDLDFLFRLQRKHVAENLFRGLTRDFVAANRAMRHADRGVKEPQVIVNFCNRPDGTARAAACGFLIDRNRRAESFDGIDIRTFHLVEKLTGVGGQRFHIAALPFRVDRVERERGLPGPAQSGNHGQRISRNADADIPKVMLTGAGNRNFF